MLNLGLFDIFVPIVVLIIAVLYIPVTVCGIVKERRFYQLTSWNKFQQAWFARFWLFFGWASRFLFAHDVETVLSQAHGVVLDIGTGSGDWLYMFAAARNKNISKLLVLEPNRHFHNILRTKAEQLGLTGKYEILSGGVEDLAGMGIQKGTIDTISTIHVLCSIGSLESSINELYQYLKTGGKWLVYEHIKVRDNKSAAAVVQGEYTVPYFSTEN